MPARRRFRRVFRIRAAVAARILGNVVNDEDIIPVIRLDCPRRN